MEYCHQLPGTDHDIACHCAQILHGYALRKTSCRVQFMPNHTTHNTLGHCLARAELWADGVASTRRAVMLTFAGLSRAMEEAQSLEEEPRKFQLQMLRCRMRQLTRQVRAVGVRCGGQVATALMFVRDRACPISSLRLWDPCCLRLGSALLPTPVPRNSSQPPSRL